MSDLESLANDVIQNGLCDRAEDKVSIAISIAKRMLVDSIWKAANVEGLGTTYPNTEAILNNLPVTTTRDEVLFCLNMRDAWKFLLDNLDYNNCWMLLREFNKIVGRDLIYGCGEIRRVDVSIGGTSWKPVIPIEHSVYDYIHVINEIEDPIDRAMEYFCYLCRAQLFIDGNKRVAQLMANKVLIENGVGIFSIPVDKRESFFASLISYYESGDSTNFKLFLKKYCIILV